jgi:hypothetical protein
LQFVGEANANRLQHYLFENTFFRNWVSPEVVETFYAYFKREPVRFSHAVSMLLTLSLASKQYAMQAKNISG